MGGNGGTDGTAGIGGSGGVAGTNGNGGTDGTAGMGGANGTAGGDGVGGTAGTGGADGAAGEGGGGGMPECELEIDCGDLGTCVKRFCVERMCLYETLPDEAFCAALSGRSSACLDGVCPPIWSNCADFFARDEDFCELDPEPNPPRLGRCSAGVCEAQGSCTHDFECWDGGACSRGQCDEGSGTCSLRDAPNGTACLVPPIFGTCIDGACLEGCFLILNSDEPDLVIGPTIDAVSQPPGSTVELDLFVDGDTRVVKATLMDAWRLATPAQGMSETATQNTLGNEELQFAIQIDTVGRYYVDLELCGDDCDALRVVYTLNRRNAGPGSDAINDGYERIVYENGVPVRSKLTCTQIDSIVIQ